MITETVQLIALKDVDHRPMTERDRQLAQLRAAAPMRPNATHGRHSADTVGLPLFEPTLL